MWTLLQAFVVTEWDRVTSEDGATMVEYGIMIALIAALSIGVIGLIGTKVFNAFTGVNASL
ncbi:MAG: Flp family type IVb pilin [Actinomycetia bacterium]|nr:Flp family type IVb pilin [Actinomycetes bacterium]